MGRYFLFYGGGSVELRPGETAVGRGKECHVRIHESWVSRRHAAFRLRGHELSVVDLGSRNGTRVNGELIFRETALSAPDEVSLGHPRATVVIRDEDSLEPDTAVVDPFADASPERVAPGDVTCDGDRLPDTAPPPRRERRRHRRHKVELPIRYESEALQVEAISVDLSSSGVFIQTPILDEIGTRCRLTVHTGQLGGLDLCGEVRRVVDHPGAREPLGLGIEFGDLEDSARRWLEQTLARGPTGEAIFRG